MKKLVCIICIIILIFVITCDKGTGPTDTQSYPDTLIVHIEDGYRITYTIDGLIDSSALTQEDINYYDSTEEFGWDKIIFISDKEADVKIWKEDTTIYHCEITEEQSYLIFLYENQQIFIFKEKTGKLSLKVYILQMINWNTINTMSTEIVKRMVFVEDIPMPEYFKKDIDSLSNELYENDTLFYRKYELMWY